MHLLSYTLLSSAEIVPFCRLGSWRGRLSRQLAGWWERIAERQRSREIDPVVPRNVHRN